eukprot:1138608-Pelagomonas_calceolata.AAC.3
MRNWEGGCWKGCYRRVRCTPGQTVNKRLGPQVCKGMGNVSSIAPNIEYKPLRSLPCNPCCGAQGEGTESFNCSWKATKVHDDVAEMTI